MANKIVNRFNIKVIASSLFFLSLFSAITAQINQLNVIKSYKVYKKSIENDSSKKMVELKTIMPEILYDLRYATINNFMHQPLYKKGDMAFLRQSVAFGLGKIEAELSQKDLALKIWDAYRPYSVTKRMWDLIRDDRYVADPKKGSGHNKGIAVDLTIIERSSGKELNMGTDFDNFSDTAHHNFKNLSPEILQNRSLLKTLMEKYGFKSLETEWWHYYWPDSEFELLDIMQKKFKKNIK